MIRTRSIVLGLLCALALLSVCTQSGRADTAYSWRNYAGLPGGIGSADGTGTDARFCYPTSVAVDASGNVYVADYGNDTIRRISPAGVATTLAGLAGSSGSADGTGSEARFNSPYGVAVDGSGNVYVADTYNNTIRKVTPSGVVTTLAGLAGSYGSSNGTGSAARFFSPRGVAVDSSGNVYVADTYNDMIRKVTPAGVVTTLAGIAGYPGSDDGAAGTATFYRPSGVAVDSAGIVYVADSSNRTIRKVDSGWVSTLAGVAGSDGDSDGTGSGARFSWPWGVAVDSTANVYVADTYNYTIRKITPGRVVTTIGGLAGYSGSTDGIGSAARFAGPTGVAVDSSGNVYVADRDNDRISTSAAGATNHAPAVSFGSAPAYIYEGMTVNLSATALDSDAGQTLTYTFTQTAGQPVSLGTASAPGSPLPANLVYPFTLPTGSLTSVANQTLTFSLTAADSGSPSMNSPAATVTVMAYMAGDADHDDKVILYDLKLLVAAWNSTPASPNWNPGADFDGSGSVILYDLKLLVASWNRFLS